MVKKINQTRTEGFDGDEYEKMVANVRGMIWSKGRGDFELLAAKSGLSKSTISKLAWGHTKRPQDRTITLILSALGLKRVTVSVELIVPEEQKPDKGWEATMRRSLVKSVK